MNILSLGAGVQSTTLCLMSLHGEVPLFDAAIFADTQAEPPSVYQHLEWLEAQIAERFPLYRVTEGSLETEMFLEKNAKSHKGMPPFYSINRNTKEGMTPDKGGHLWRRCTQDFKLKPIRHKIRELQGIKGRMIYQYIGISFDERGRMKESGVKDIQNVYPLVDRRIRRDDCLRWLSEHGYPEPPKSACVWCPYHSNSFWKEMKERRPEEFDHAVAFDTKLREGKLPGVTGDCYVHRLMIPLELAVKTDSDIGQERLFDPYDCEGACGV